MNITDLKGVGTKRTHALQSVGIFSVEDLLNHFPRDYDDRSKVKKISELIPEAVNTIRGVVAFEPESANVGRKKFSLTKVIIKDQTGVLEIVWFNQPYLKKYFKKGNEYIFTGMVRENAKLQMLSPDYEPASETLLSGGRIVPVYSPPPQFSQKTFRALIYQALQHAETFEERLSAEIRQKYKLCDRETAIRNIHFPENNELFLEARRCLVFEELFFSQLALLQIKANVQAEQGIVFAALDFAPFLAALPFAPTQAQARVMAEIASDTGNGKRMNRLIQGDVGSGKTAVAFAAIFLAAKNGFQSALMAPTDVLAAQHYTQCKKLFALFGYETVFLTGANTAKERRQILQKIENGTANIIIGTHALIQEKVQYHSLGLCITDEQHRFGVNQRLALSKKGVIAPHVLVMSATPIPRTLGLILYGDLDISIINELPPGRQEIKTYCVNSSYRERLYAFIRKEIAEARQAYVICARAEHGEDSDVQNVISYTQTLSAALPEIKIAYLHGKMGDKQELTAAFKAGEIQVLVATTVVEVGIHAENATLIIVENAERFGLSQLHQLRGRVGRGTAQSYCVLVTDSKNEQTRARMKAMSQTCDGFKLAELDLQQRGAGDFFGTRQHGLPSFRVANLYSDLGVLEEAREAARGHSPFSPLYFGGNIVTSL
ncbi:MAG: ATP-dependent DNA helicase RecG [Defluviitaleaceae bacterium]|nr:ATP-dependent DNA helicase RecG [Defluviitaleaceae bacterium]